MKNFEEFNMNENKEQTEKVHISTIVWGDTVIHDGEMKTVGKKDIKHENDSSSTLFGDSYKAGNKLVKKVIFNEK